MKKLITLNLIAAIIILASLSSTSLRAQQTAFLSLNEIYACPADTVTVVLHVENLINAGAVTLHIGYDSTVLQYEGYGNVNPAFIGLLANPVTSPATQVSIAWSSLMGATLNSGTLVEFTFVYLGGECPVTFNPEADITTVNLMPIPFETTDGFATIDAPYILESPADAVIITGQNAVFSVVAEGATSYQWQESDGSEWYDLQNNATYQNVNGPSLTIVSTTVDMDSLMYRCKVFGPCSQISDSAILTVLPELTALLTLGNASACAGEEIHSPVKGFALNDVIEFAFYITYLPEYATFAGIDNVHPMIEGAVASTFTSPIPHVRIIWSASNGVNLPDGTLFDLVFIQGNQNSPLIFMENTFVRSAGNFNYNLSLINAQISPLPQPMILQHPSDTLVHTMTIAQFNVMANGASAYHWHESRDNGASWQPLQNIAPYAGVLTQQLSVAPVPPSFDGYRYKCLVSGEHCQVISNPALLNVDTLTSVKPAFLLPSFALATWSVHSDHLMLGFDAPSGGSLHLQLFDLSGKLIAVSQTEFAQAGRNNLQINRSKSSSSILIFNAVFQDQNRRIYQTTGKLPVF
jgi:hypothetical protein